MDEPLDVYTDQFQINLGPFGCVLNFMVSEPVPQAPGTAPQNKRLATMRMSMEHLKAMTFILHRQIAATEARMRTNAQLPMEVLNSMQISREDWDAFWKES
jgi:hypothetical protein